MLEAVDSLLAGGTPLDALLLTAGLAAIFALRRSNRRSGPRRSD
jgi:hypothetical protein